MHTLYSLYLFRVKSRSQGQDYRVLDLDLVEFILLLLFIILFKIRGDNLEVI